MTEEKTGGDPREEWTPEERALYDARAEEEAWSYALSILNPMLEISRQAGSPKLERVMQGALAEAQGELNRALDTLEPLVERGESC